MPGKPVLYPSENQEFFYRILEQAFQNYDENSSSERYETFWLSKLRQEFVSVAEIEVDEAGEQSKKDDVEDEVTDEPLAIFSFYVSLLFFSQISPHPPGGKGSFP